MLLVSVLVVKERPGATMKKGCIDRQTYNDEEGLYRQTGCNGG